MRRFLLLALLTVGVTGCGGSGSDPSAGGPPDSLIEKVVMLGNISIADPVGLLEVVAPDEHPLMLKVFILARVIEAPIHYSPPPAADKPAIDKALADLTAALESHGLEDLYIKPGEQMTRERVKRISAAVEGVDAAAVILEVFPILARIRGLKGKAFKRRRPLPDEVGRAKQSMKIDGDRATMRTLLDEIVLLRTGDKWFLSLRETFEARHRPEPD